MKFKTSEYLTVADLKSEDYKALKEQLKAYKEKDFINDICIYSINNTNTNKEILKIESVEIVKDNDIIIPWVNLIARDNDNFYEISMNFYDCSNNFTVTFSRK